MMTLPLFALVAAATAPAAGAAPDAHAAKVEAWRREREARLRAPDGWLTLIGLTWLHAGANRFGGAPDDDIALPAAAPPHAGTLQLDGATVHLRLGPGAPVTVNGRRPSASEVAAPLALRSDAGEAAPDVVGIGAVTIQVIARGGRLGARVRDPDSPARRQFSGCRWYPIAPGFRAVARLAPHARPATLVVPDASGGHQELESPGSLSFSLAGRPLRLEPVRDGPDPTDLLVVFRDATSGHDTYGGGRFLRARRQPDGAFILDFNEAYAPPCAFTPYATCPLPPPQNRLDVAITAGEKTPPGAAHQRASDR